MHPATLRAAKTSVTALGAVTLDVGAVFPPRSGQERGYGLWQNRDLNVDDIMSLLPTLAAQNSRGGNIFVRLGPSATTTHPGLAMIDDLTAEGVDRLNQEGMEPCLVTLTSVENYQAWIRLTSEGVVPYETMKSACRWLAEEFEGDIHAVSPRQPGRLPGFTNRKPKHQRADGSFPFAKVIMSSPGCVATRGDELIRHLSDTARRAAGMPPETPHAAKQGCVEGPIDTETSCNDSTNTWPLLHQIMENARSIVADQVERGTRPAMAATQSEIDFLAARRAIDAGIKIETIARFLSANRPEKPDDYGRRTAEAALQHAKTKLAGDYTFGM